MKFLNKQGSKNRMRLFLFAWIYSYKRFIMIKYLCWMCLISPLFLVSCEEPKTVEKTEVVAFKLSNEAEDLYKIVGDKHDVAMKLMGDIERTKSTLRLKMQNLEAGVQKDSILDLLTELKKADDGMMDWMREFKSTELNEEDYKEMSEEQIMGYLKEEEQKIEQVHKDMLSSIANGKKFLGQ